MGPAGREYCGTGFSREGVGRHTAKSTAHTLAPSRLKPVLLKSIACIQKDCLNPNYAGLTEPNSVGRAGREHCGTGFTGRRRSSRHKIDGARTGPFPAEAGPTKKAPRAPRGLAEPEQCGTGFSRECVGRHTTRSMANALAPSRLKPVPLKKHRVHPEGMAEPDHCGTG